MTSDNAVHKPRKRRTSARLKRRGATTEKRIAELNGEARVMVIEGPARGTKFTVEDGMTFGRGKSATVCLDAPDISRVHARITLGPGHLIEDLGSRNGTFVNGLPVDQPMTLHYGDRVRIGAETILLFTHVDPAEEELAKRQRLGLLGRIAAGVAHDVNNLLGVILSTQDFLLDTPEDTPMGDAEMRDCMLEVRAAAERAAHLMPKLLSFARGQSHGYGPFDMSAVCEEVAQLVNRTFDRRIRVETRIKPGLMVVGDRVELHHVIMNLCVNARDAMPRGGKLAIATRRERITTRDGVGAMGVVVEVADSGEGMDEATRERIFEPFFTTKSRGRGSGLGLATAKEMVTLHGGTIEVRSDLGCGTVFRIALPLDTARKRVETMTVMPDAPTRAQSRRLLLVDDDPMCRRAFSRLLKRGGHEVAVVGSGQEAIDHIRTSGHTPDVVLLDVDMPQMSGEETLRRLRAMHPQLRVLVITGNRNPERQQAMFDGGALALLPKPFTQEQLLREVQEAAVRTVSTETPASTLRGVSLPSLVRR